MQTVHEVIETLAKYSSGDICYVSGESLMVIDGEEFSEDLSEIILEEVALPFDCIPYAHEYMEVFA